jgi:hypothetical protein
VNHVINSNNCVTGSIRVRHIFVSEILLLTCPQEAGNKINHNIMGNLLYIIAVILIIGWALGFFYFSAGGVIHVLLVIAIIAILFQVIRGRRID